MPPSIYKPESTISSAPPSAQAAFANEQVGYASGAVAPPAPAPWERYLKQALAAIVIGCGVSVQFLSPAEDAGVIKVCSIIAAIGAGLGITSSGNPPKR